MFPAGCKAHDKKNLPAFPRPPSPKIPSLFFIPNGYNLFYCLRHPPPLSNPYKKSDTPDKFASLGHR
jgi:hypothetical protein